MIQRQIGRGFVEIPSSEHFRVQDTVKSIGIKFVNERVVQNHGGMHDSTERWELLSNSRNCLADIVRIGHVGPNIHHSDAGSFQPLQISGNLSTRPRATHQRQIACPLGDHPFGNVPAKAAGTPRDQVRGFGFQQVTGFAARSDGDLLAGKREDVLAHMLTLSHVSKRIDYLGDRKHLTRQGTVVACRKPLCQFIEH